MSNMLTTTIAVAVHREGINPLFGEGVIRVELQDEAAGPFLVLSADLETMTPEGLRIDMEELEAVVVAARSLVAGYPDKGDE